MDEKTNVTTTETTNVTPPAAKRRYWWKAIAPLTEFLKYETEKTWEKTLERGERENRKKRLEEIR